MEERPGSGSALLLELELEPCYGSELGLVCALHRCLVAVHREAAVLLAGQAQAFAHVLLVLDHFRVDRTPRPAAASPSPRPLGNISEERRLSSAADLFQWQLGRCLGQPASLVVPTVRLQ